MQCLVPRLGKDHVCNAGCNACTNLLYRTYRVGMAQTENMGAGGHMPLVPPRPVPTPMHRVVPLEGGYNVTL